LKFVEAKITVSSELHEIESRKLNHKKWHVAQIQQSVKMSLKLI